MKPRFEIYPISKPRASNAPSRVPYRLCNSIDRSRRSRVLIFDECIERKASNGVFEAKKGRSRLHPSRIAIEIPLLQPLSRSRLLGPKSLIFHVSPRVFRGPMRLANALQETQIASGGAQSADQCSPLLAIWRRLYRKCGNSKTVHACPGEMAPKRYARFWKSRICDAVASKWPKQASTGQLIGLFRRSGSLPEGPNLLTSARLFWPFGGDSIANAALPKPCMHLLGLRGEVTCPSLHMTRKQCSLSLS